LLIYILGYAVIIYKLCHVIFELALKCNLQYKQLEESDEGGYTAQCLELPAAISKGYTKEEALKNITETIQLVLEVTQEQARAYTEVFKVEVASA